MLPLLIVLFFASQVQGQIIYGNPKQYVCAGKQFAFYTDLSQSSATCTWQISTDNGQNWTTITANATYPYPNFSTLTIRSVDASMNNALYRFWVTAYPQYISQPDTLVVFSAPANAPIFVNPPTDVCQGQSLALSVTADDPLDSLYWSASGAGVQQTWPNMVNDTRETVNFSSAGTATIQVYAINGCYPDLRSSSTATITVTVHPLQTGLAATAGGGPVCSTLSAYPAAATTFSDGSCTPMVALTPSGASPVSGTITSCVTVDATVQSFNGIPYVPRHYSLEPSVDAATSTATVTLYFTQGDFDAYNIARGSAPALPAGPSDATGISNLHITQFHGTGTTPDTYAGGSGDIDPADNNIVWNASASRWEVTFTITGFSGFFVSGSPMVILPLTLTDFSGKATSGGNLLSWTTASEENTAYFELQREPAGGATFTDVARIPAAGNSHQSLQYSYQDELSGASAAWSYRLTMVDLDGKFTFSKIITLQPPVNELSVRLIPNPFVQPSSLTVFSPAAGAALLSVTDLSGKKLIEKALSLLKGENAVDVRMLGGLAPGMYLLRVGTSDQQQTLKFIKE
jgi:hypothetical protein